MSLYICVVVDGDFFKPSGVDRIMRPGKYGFRKKNRIRVDDVYFGLRLDGETFGFDA